MLRAAKYPLDVFCNAMNTLYTIRSTTISTLPRSLLIPIHVLKFALCCIVLFRFYLFVCAVVLGANAILIPRVYAPDAHRKGGHIQHGHAIFFTYLREASFRPQRRWKKQDYEWRKTGI